MHSFGQEDSIRGLILTVDYDSDRDIGYNETIVHPSIVSVASSGIADLINTITEDVNPKLNGVLSHFLVN